MLVSVVRRLSSFLSSVGSEFLVVDYFGQVQFEDLRLETSTVSPHATKVIFSLLLSEDNISWVLMQSTDKYKYRNIKIHQNKYI